MNGEQVFLDSNIILHLLSGDQNLLSDLSISGYPSEFKEIIINIRSKKKLKLPDAIIAATAIYYNAPLVTAHKAFNNIDNLKLIQYQPTINE